MHVTDLILVLKIIVHNNDIEDNKYEIYFQDYSCAVPSGDLKTSHL